MEDSGIARHRSPGEKDVKDNQSGPSLSTEPQNNGKQNTEHSFYPYKSTNEYAEAVRQWLIQYRFQQTCQQNYYTLSMLNMLGMMSQSHPLSRSAAGVATPPGQAVPPGTPAAQPAAPRILRQPEPTQPRQRDCKIASIWKRIGAEVLDFILLFIVKIVVTFIAVEQFGLIKKPNYEYLSFDQIHKASAEEFGHLVAWALASRLSVSVFEALCLRGTPANQGGATPGKKAMGIKVVSCLDVLDLPNGMVRVSPAANMGFWNALVRTIVKNFSNAFFFPVCITVFFFQQNRAAYDIISNSIVVEEQI